MSRKRQKPRSRGTFSTYAILRSPEDQRVVNEFARRLQAAMDAKGWNQSELARQLTLRMPKAVKGQKQNLSFNRDRISHYVNGKHMPRPESLAVMAEVLGCKQSDLMPPLGVPTGADAPSFEMRGIGADRVALRLNRTVSADTASAILKLLKREDEK